MAGRLAARVYPRARWRPSKGLDFAESLGLEPTIDVHDDSGAIVGRQIRHPITWTPPLEQRRTAPPRLGQNTRDVVGMAGRDRDRPHRFSGNRTGS